MSTPIHCPNCGKADEFNCIRYEGTNDFDPAGYDCYCRLCDWSGEIQPDED